MASPLDSFRVVLTDPIYGGNIGSVCRAMANMGLGNLVIAAGGKPDETEALRMARSAAPLFHERRETATLAEAVAGCVAVAGTSARTGLYRSHAFTPREAAPLLLDYAARGPVALVFGRETNGLSNDELALCTHIIRIPSTPESPSLNLAQAAMLCLYELYVAAGDFEAPREASPPADSALRERMLAIWEKALLEIGFMKDDKARHMMMGLRRIFSRGRLSVNDTRILMGIARQMLWCASRANAPGADTDSRVNDGRK